MSHNTTINEMVFSDIDALKAAVQDLNKAGIKSRLIEKAVPRAYTSGQLAEAPYVLKLEDGRYDVGFYYNKEKKGYEAKTDFYAGHIQKFLGATTEPGESRAQAGMGRLFAAYAIQATTRQAIRKGYSVRRVTTANGHQQLVLTGMAGS